MAGGRGNSRSTGSARRAGSNRSRRPERQRGGRKAGARLRAGLRTERVASAARALGLSTTRRAAIFALVVCALAFTLAVPLRTYLSQRAAVAEQMELRGSLTEQVQELERRKAELADPVQIEAEARRRLRYVMPGETPYIVQLPEDAKRAEEAEQASRARQLGPWYENLWTSVSGVRTPE